MVLEKQGQLHITDDVSIRTFEKLDAVIYETVSTMLGSYLVKRPTFALPPKLYNTDEDLIQRVIEHSTISSGNTGVLLTGVKGSGKTVLAKKLCLDLDRPVVLVNENTDIGFIRFLCSRKELGKAVFLIDEYDKIFIGDRENDLLTLLDGVHASNHVFILTTNSLLKVSPHVINRPGRIRYKKEFNYLTVKEVKEVAEDLLLDKSTMHSLLTLVEERGKMTYDILTALISEMNLNREDAFSSARVFNYHAEEFIYEVFLCFMCERDSTRRRVTAYGKDHHSIRDLLDNKLKNEYQYNLGNELVDLGFQKRSIKPEYWSSTIFKFPEGSSRSEDVVVEVAKKKVTFWVEIVKNTFSSYHF